MSTKAPSILQKVQHDRGRGNYDKALKRLTDGIRKYPGEVELFKEAVEVGLEAGESFEAVQFFRRAYVKFPAKAFELWQHAQDNVEKFNDPVLAKFMIEHAIKKRELQQAYEVAAKLKDVQRLWCTLYRERS